MGQFQAGPENDCRQGIRAFFSDDGRNGRILVGNI